ncbi:MAG: DMT family transporter [Motiliproteus sp.]
MQLSQRGKGLVITLSGVALLIPDALALRLSGLESWNAVFWRNLLAGVVILIWLLLSRRQQHPLTVLKISPTSWVLTAIIAVASIGFVLSLMHTSVANTLIILALAPMFSAFYDRLFRQQQLPLRTWLAILCCLFGVGILVSDNFGNGSQTGNLLALMTAILMGIEFSLLATVPQQQIWPALGLGYIGATLFALLCATLTSISLSLANANLLAVAAMGLVIIPFAFMLISQGPRYLPAPEVAMLMMLETVCAPFLVWWVLDEDPGQYALLGGAIVISTLVLHSILDLVQERRSQATAGARNLASK